MYTYIMIVIVLVLTIPTVNASSARDLTEEERESGFYDERGYIHYTKDRPAINPDFDPDEDCSIKHELKCVPGTEQECPEGFNPNEDNICGLDDCLEGYVYADEDESGLCITYEECEGGFHADNSYILIKEDGRCALGYFVCDDPEHREQDYCVEYCDENSDKEACDPQHRAERDANAALWCDGNPRGIGDDFLAQLPKLADDQCFGTCEMPNRQLVCDIENRE